MQANTGKIHIQSLRKETAILFLAIFYFVIATNTQTGWLFVLSAFLLGLLVLSFGFSRAGAIKALNLEQTWRSPPRRGQAFRVRSILKNESLRGAPEVRLQAGAPSWADQSSSFLWTLPWLPDGETASTEHRLLPTKRGEHKLPPVDIICGAPFGLFTVFKRYQSEATFLVYPELQKLPSKATRNALATALGESTSPRGKGDSRVLRSLRDYQPGDDLRHVHWKASAKRGPGAQLLVREHQAPAPQRSILLLDRSCETKSTADDTSFEKAVSLTASILWSAHQQGTRTLLVLQDEQKGWQMLKNWSDQYEALARVELLEQSSEDGLQKAQELFDGSYSKELSSSSLSLVKAWLPETQLESWPIWADRIFLVSNTELLSKSPQHPKLLALDANIAEFQELRAGSEVASV